PGATIHTDEYWIRMTRQAVYFQDATEQALAAGHNQLVEISPNPVALMGMMNTAFSVGKPDAQLLISLKRKVDPSESLLDLLAKLYVTGSPVDFRMSLVPAPVTLPATPRSRRRLRSLRSSVFGPQRGHRQAFLACRAPA